MTRFLTNFAVGLGGGLVGAVALTAAHELLRTHTPLAPRMDVLGMRALAKAIRAFGGKPPRKKTLWREAMVLDLASNAAWYALAARGRHPFGRGLLLGLLAGFGAVELPPRLGLGKAPRGRTALVKAETVGLYALGGVVAGAVIWMFRAARESRVLEDARAVAEEEAGAPINARPSGMIH